MSNLEELKKNLELKLEDCNIHLNLEDFESVEELTSEVYDNNLCNEDVIYYATAIEYLQKEDNSLKESIEIACDFGYSLENITSELLASLLASRRNEENFQELISELEEYYELKEEEC